MSDAIITEVQMWHEPPFYLTIKWTDFSNCMSEESQWETLLALLKAGSRSLLGDNMVIHLKSSENPWGYGKPLSF